MPKFLLPLTGHRSLLQQTVDRLAPLASPERTLVVCGPAHAAGVARQLPELPTANVIVEPLPNYGRQPAFSWDAYLEVPDPDALAGEFASRGVRFSTPIMDRDDGLRGFEVKDLDGYGLFFGRVAPRIDA